MNFWIQWDVVVGMEVATLSHPEPPRASGTTLEYRCHGTTRRVYGTLNECSPRCPRNAFRAARGPTPREPRNDIATVGNAPRVVPRYLRLALNMAAVCGQVLAMKRQRRALPQPARSARVNHTEDVGPD